MHFPLERTMPGPCGHDRQVSASRVEAEFSFVPVAHEHAIRSSDRTVDTIFPVEAQEPMHLFESFCAVQFAPQSGEHDVYVNAQVPFRYVVFSGQAQVAVRSEAKVGVIPETQSTQAEALDWEKQFKQYLLHPEVYAQTASPTRLVPLAQLQFSNCVRSLAGVPHTFRSSAQAATHLAGLPASTQPPAPHNGWHPDISTVAHSVPL